MPKQSVPAPKIIPIHDLPQQVVAHRRGHAKPIEVQPTVEDLQYHAEIERQRAIYVEDHPLVVANQPKGSSGSSTIDTLNQVKLQIATEAATLEFNRKEYEKRGVNTSQISTRIVNCWRQVAQLQLEVQKHGVVVIDPNSEEMQRIFKMWVEILQRVTAEMVTEGTLSTESLDLFFSKFSKAMEGWEGRLG